LYNYIITNADKVIYIRIRDLANETHVSTSTILRFCRKLNCEGFSEFKGKLKLYLKESKPTSHKEMKHFLSEFMERTMKEDFEKRGAELVTKAENVLFTGFDSSGILAQYGARYFSISGKFSLYINDPYFPIHTRYLHNCMVIALSVSGETDHTINQINRLKKQGNQIFSITNHKNCTLAHISDLKISYYVTEERNMNSYQPIDMTTQLPVIYILEFMAREVHRQLDENPRHE